MMFKVVEPPPISPLKPLETVFRLGAYIGSPIRAANGDFASGNFEVTKHPKRKYCAYATLIFFLNSVVVLYWEFTGYSYVVTTTKMPEFGKSNF